MSVPGHDADFTQSQGLGRWYVVCSCGWFGRRIGYSDWSYARGAHTRHANARAHQAS